MSASVEHHPTLDPQRAVGVDAHRREHRRRFERLARARRARVDGDAVLVEREQDRLGLDAADAEAHEVGQARRRVAEALDAGHGATASPSRARSVSARAAAASSFECRHRPAPPRPRRSRRSRARPRCRRAGPVPARRRARTAGTAARAARAGRAAPFGPPNLWPVTEQRSAPERARSRPATCPAAAHASTWTIDAPLARTVDDVGRRLQRPHLVVGELHRHRARCRGGSRRAPRRRRTDRARSTPTVGDVRRRLPARTRRAPPSARPRWSRRASAAVDACHRAPDRGVHRLGAARR